MVNSIYHFLFSLYLTNRTIRVGVKRATVHDVVTYYRPLVKNAKFVLNGGLTAAEADTLIASGQIDAASFGWFFVANPDFVKKVERGIELNEVDVKKLYGTDHMTLEEAAKGYTDYKRIIEVKA